ncbi:MAG: DUF937 domain-containing protein [Proteobacteria bacterium]|nr:DUF937 domain-containing protein [Pseudomonadota bacterium]
MGLLGQVLTGVVASRIGRGGAFGGGMGGGLGGGLGGALGGAVGGPLGGVLGGAVLGGMGRGGRGSPVMKALLLLLAARTAQDFMQRRQGGDGRSAAPGGRSGGLLGGVAAGGGLGALVEQFNRTGHGDAINSWIGRGPNQKLPPRQLAEALGPETVQALQQETGMDPEDILQELSETLPEAVDQLSPDGTAPDPKLLAGDDEDLRHATQAY